MGSYNKLPRIEADHLIIGAGVAGLKLALNLGRQDRVILLTKSSLIDNNSWNAQGGIASVLDGADSFDAQVDDTLKAGAGLCHYDVVKEVVEGGPKMIEDLVNIGVQFTRSEGAEGDSEFHLTKEGGHSYRRVIHADDVTGRAVIRGLVDQVLKCSNITVLEDQFAIDLITSDKYAPDFERNFCLGSFVLDRTTGGIYSVLARQTFLCTGGHGKAYLYTSNPDSATGDGLAMAWRAGCRVANLEFMQFHPTCLYHSHAKNFLISEALRGEGAILKNRKGAPFMDTYHELGSLAPRDIVARAIDTELKKSGESFVYLDARSLGQEKLQSHFPNISKKCLEFGIDISSQMIPVVPAAHYSCGGVAVDRSGRTNISGLYALGEVACTGLHGANRLASNSLLEALVYADIVARHAMADDSRRPQPHDIPSWDSGGAVAPDELVVLSHTWDEVRRLMWNYVGIVRTTKRLEGAKKRIDSIRSELDYYYWSYQITGSLLEVRNLVDVALLTINCAMARKESRGIHYMADFPDMVPLARDTILR